METDQPTPVPKPAKRKMRPGGGKAKGSGFENTVAKLLTKHLAPLNFIRTQGSGARVGGKNFDTLGKMFGEDALKLFVGDVVPINERDTGIKFKYSVETKFYKTPDHFPSLVAGTANFFKWFEEAKVDAQKVNKNPMLIFKWNHTPIYAAFYATDVAASSLALQTPLVFQYSGNRVAVFELDILLAAPDFWMTKTS